MKAVALNWGPKRLRKWAAQIASIINANRITAGTGTTITESPGGTAVNVGKSGGGGGGGGDGTLTLFWVNDGVLNTADFNAADNGPFV